MFRHVILGILSDGVAHHGYALAKTYRQRSGADMNTGGFYRELQRLAAEGLIRAVANPPGADPRRTPYQITERGRAVFERWLFHTGDLSEGHREDGMSARALFLAGADVHLVRRLLARWHDELWIRSKVLERARDAERNRQVHGSAGATDVIVLLLSRRLKRLAADIEFLGELRTSYDARAAQAASAEAHAHSTRAEARYPASRARRGQR